MRHVLFLDFGFVWTRVSNASYINCNLHSLHNFDFSFMFTISVPLYPHPAQKLVMKSSIMVCGLFARLILLSWLPTCWSLSFDEAYVGWNLNENPSAQHPLEYDGTWEDHDFFQSPHNWRFPFYVITLDR